MDRERGALVLDGGSLGSVRLGEQPGKRVSHLLDSRRNGGRTEHACLPPLHAVVTEHDQAGHIGEAAECHRVRRGPAGDDRHRADTARQPGKRGGRARRGHRRRRVGDDRRESAVVVGGHEARAGSASIAASPARPARPGRWQCLLSLGLLSLGLLSLGLLSLGLLSLGLLSLGFRSLGRRSLGHRRLVPR